MSFEESESLIDTAAGFVGQAISACPVRFYLVAMAFVVVDIEIIFLFPWAVDSQGLGRFGLVEILVFAASVFVPFICLVANGALDWGPVKRVRPVESEAVRTSSSTVRHIGPSSDEAA
jgi:NADH-quinone oxidoreductase subunit A